MRNSNDQILILDEADFREEDLAEEYIAAENLSIEPKGSIMYT